MAEVEKSADAAEGKKTDAGGGSGEEPSMEDILKSIRGVISGDENAAGGADADSEEDDEILELTEMAEEETPTEEVNEEVKADDAAPEEDDGKSVLDNIDDALSEEGEAPAEEAKEEAAPEEAKAEEADVEPEPEPEEATGEAAEEDEVLEAEAAVKEEKVEEAVEAVEAKVDDKDKKATAAETERLLKEKVADESSETLKTLVANLPRTQIDSPYTAGGITLEQLTIEAMRPFLAEWLNENLPVIVKQIVTKEIKKLIPEEDDK